MDVFLMRTSVERSFGRSFMNQGAAASLACLPGAGAGNESQKGSAADAGESFYSSRELHILHGVQLSQTGNYCASCALDGQFRISSKAC